MQHSLDLDTIDDLFTPRRVSAEQPATAATLALPLGRRITCRVHGLPAPAEDDAVLLCQQCRADPQAAREHCEAVLAACATRADAAGQAWLDAQCAADDATLTRLRTAERLIAAGKDDARFTHYWSREKAAGTALGALFVAYEAYTTEMRAIAEQRRLAQQGIAELDAWENTK